MIRGIYTTAASMMVRQNQQELIANNLANVNAAGYKKDRMAFHNIMQAETLLRNAQQGTAVEFTQTVQEQGSFRTTSSPFDFAVDGDGFFTVEQGGRQFYTRNGHFRVNAEGALLTQTGNPVLGEGGPIVLDLEEGEVKVNQAGEIIMDGAVQDTIALARFRNPAGLQKVGSDLFEPTATSGAAREVEPEEKRVLQGHLEESNVNPVEEMVEMVVLLRDFTQNQKSMQTQDDTLRRVVNQLGRTS